jgi:uncharacterized protein
VKIRVAEITDRGKVLEVKEPVSAFTVLMEAQKSGECEFTTPISVVLSMVQEFGHIRVTGSVSFEVNLSCSRCLSGFNKSISSHFTAYYTKSATIKSEEEVELLEEDLISVTYQGDEIDFTDEIAEQVLLELPYKPLCSEDCPGLCSSCGEDLNLGPCSCGSSAAKLAFSPLEGFKVNNKGE